MLKNARVTAFTVSEFLRENQQGGRVKLPPPTPRLGIMISMQKKLLERSTQNNWKTQIKNLELKK